MKTLMLIFAFALFGCGHNSDQATDPQNTSTTQQAPTPTPTPQQKFYVQNGHWGGEQISLDVSRPRSKYELSCAHGTIDQPLQLDQFNRFSATGTLTPEHGGPLHPGDPAVTYKAQFDGFAVGGMMDLRIRYQPTGSPEQTQTYRLQYNEQPMLTKCL